MREPDFATYGHPAYDPIRARAYHAAEAARYAKLAKRFAIAAIIFSAISMVSTIYLIAT